jgi:hypothetical protein
MMKRIVMLGVLVGALLGATSLSWAVDFKWGGDYRLRGFYIDNLTDQDEDTQDSAAYYSSRFLLTLAATEDNVSGVVTLAAGRSFATNSHANRLLGDTPYGPDANTDVGILEAYIKADFRSWGLKGGRAIYKLGNSIILDDAVDGLWANFGLGAASLTVGTLKVVELTDNTAVGIGNNAAPLASTGTAGDADLYVINAGFGKMEMGPAHNLNLFAAYLTDREATLFGGGAAVDDDATLLILGVSADADLGALRLKGEFDYLTGEQNVAATKRDLEGMNLVLGGKMTAGVVPIGVDLIYTTGQDAGASEVNVNGLNGNYPVGIILTNSGARSLDTKDGTCLSINGGSLGGSSNCYGGQGLTAIKLSSGYTHGPHVVDVAAIWAQATEDAGPGTDTDIGIEIDATLTWALTKRLSAMGGIGYLLSGDFYGPNADEQTVLVTQLAYTF